MSDIKTMELLSPGGDIDSIKAAISAGADAIYCGLDKFNARNRATNIDFDQLLGIVKLAHEHSCKIFVTLNIVIVDSEFPTLFNLLNRLVNSGVDGVIVQDFGFLYILQKFFPSFEVHASTQMTTHNAGQIEFLKQLSVSRVNLCRELSISEIADLTGIAHNNEISTEVFVHGSNCICFSGLCYISSIHSGNSGNRGRCSQPCRDQFEITKAGKSFPLNLKDNSAFSDLPALAKANVDSLKIEGRIKKFHYVYTIVKAWRKNLQNFYKTRKNYQDKSELYSVFNRDFSNSFLIGKIDNMFIDNPRDNSALQLAEAKQIDLEQAKAEVYDLRTEMIKNIKNEISSLSVNKTPIKFIVSGKVNEKLSITVETTKATKEFESSSSLRKTNNAALDTETLFNRFKALSDTAFQIESFEVNISESLSLPFKEIVEIRKKVFSWLNDSREFIEPVEFSRLKRINYQEVDQKLSVLIASFDDVVLTQPNADLYFQMPNSFGKNFQDFIDFFCQNNKVVPYFPAVLIGDNFNNAVNFLEKVKPTKIVTNNSGLALAARRMGVDWIAGPQLNITNSYSLICLQEKFGCRGAFISGELKKGQIKAIKKPEGFELFYTIYQPLELMTSRVCLFQQVTGCSKEKRTNDCILECEKSASITDLKGRRTFIEKSRGNYHHVYNGTNFLNVEVIKDVPNTFDSFMVDMRNISTDTRTAVSKDELVRIFSEVVGGTSTTDLNEIVYPTTNASYKKGI